MKPKFSGKGEGLLLVVSFALLVLVAFAGAIAIAHREPRVVEFVQIAGAAWTGQLMTIALWRRYVDGAVQQAVRLLWSRVGTPVATSALMDITFGVLVGAAMVGGWVGLWLIVRRWCSVHPDVVEHPSA